MEELSVQTVKIFWLQLANAVHKYFSLSDSTLPITTACISIRFSHEMLTLYSYDDSFSSNRL